MKILIICWVSFVVVYCVPILDDDLSYEWMLFKHRYNKQYKSIDEEIARQVIWKAILGKIQQHNFEADLDMHSFTLSMNRFGDMTYEEIQREKNGYKFPSQVTDNFDRHVFSSSIDLVYNNSTKSMTSNCLTNAWIFLNEDEPSNTNYNSSNSCYQTLIQNKIYQSVDILFIAFASTNQTSPNTIPPGNGSSYTLIMAPVPHPSGLTNLDYMIYMISDARKTNPNITLSLTLNWGDGNLISNIFSPAEYSPEENAANFAANLIIFLKNYDLDGFDIDWESPICDKTTKEQFRLLFNAIGAQFKQQTQKHYYLTLSPAAVGNLDADAVNQNVDFVNLQLYSGFTHPDDFQNAGINPKLFAYGTKFEDRRQTATDAYRENKDHYHYNKFTVWRLNSVEYIFEQTQQQILHQLCNTN